MRRVSIYMLAPTLFALASCENGGDTPDKTDDTGEPPPSLNVDGDDCDADRDCDDNDPTRCEDYAEECDGIDNDCDESVDEEVTTQLYADNDGDSFGDGAPVEGCEGSSGYVTNSDDCDDTNADVNPDAAEQCDGIDNDCNGQIDDGTADSVWYYDADQDGYGDPDNYVEDCIQPEGYVDNALDCDDTDALEPVHVMEGGYVDTGWGWDTADTGGYGTEAMPYGSVQDGILAANSCVHVHAGEYYEDVDFFGKDVAVIGVDGAENTFITGSGTTSVVTFASGEDSDAMLSGFTITGGGGTWSEEVLSEECGSGVTCTSYYVSYRGGGIYIDGASPTLSDLIVTGNVLPSYSFSESGSVRTYISSQGGGIYVTNTDLPTAMGIAVTSNSADIGGGVYVNTGSVTDWGWAWVEGNAAAAGGGFYTSGQVTMGNSVFANNTSSGRDTVTGGAAADVSDSGGSFSIVNVAMYNNVGVAMIYATSESSVAIANSILFENADGPCLDGETDSSLSITYSDVYGCTDDPYGAWSDETGNNGNLASDPLFVDAGGGDFHLMPRSPAVDAGDPAPEYNDTDGTRNDMGAYGGENGSW
ncbi:MAG: MopE-related protein [Myxococcota bacterium]